MPKVARRGSPRFTAEHLGDLRVPFVQRARLVRGHEHEELFLIDLGAAGVFAERKDPLPVGERVTLTFRLPGNDQDVRAVCRVAWWHPPGGRLVSKSLPAGIGLEFVEISARDRARLSEHLLDYLSRDTMGRRFHRSWPLGEGEDEP